MTGTLNAPGNTPAVDGKFFDLAWNNFFGDLATAVNAASPLANPSFTGTVTVPILAVTGAATFASTIAVTGAATFSGAVAFNGQAAFTGNVGLFGKVPVAQGTITGSRSTGAALTVLLAYLASRGDIVNATGA